MASMDKNNKDSITKFALGAAAVTAATAVGATAHADATPNNQNNAVPVDQATTVQTPAQQTQAAKNQMNQDQATNDAAQAAAQQTAQQKTNAQHQANQAQQALNQSQSNESAAQKAVNAAQHAADEATPDNIAKANNQVQNDQQAVSNAQQQVTTTENLVDGEQSVLAQQQKEQAQAQKKADDTKATMDQAAKALDTQGAQTDLDAAKAKQSQAKQADDQAQTDVNNAQDTVNTANQSVTNATNQVNNANSALTNAKNAAKPADDAVASAQNKANDAKSKMDNAKTAYDSAVKNANSSASGVNVNNAAQGITVSFKDANKVHQIVDQINNAKANGLTDTQVNNLVNQLKGLVNINYRATDDDWNHNLHIPEHEQFNPSALMDRASDDTMSQADQDQLQIFLNATMNKIISTLGLHYGTFAPSRTFEKMFWKAIDDAKTNDNTNQDGTHERGYNDDTFYNNTSRQFIHNVNASGLPDYMASIHTSGMSGANNGWVNNRTANNGSGVLGMIGTNDVPYLAMANVKYAMINSMFYDGGNWADYIEWNEFNQFPNLLDKPSTIVDNFSNFNRGASLKILGGTPEFYGLPQTDSHAQEEVNRTKASYEAAKATYDNANNALTTAKANAANANAKVKDAQNALNAANNNLTTAQHNLATAKDRLATAQAHKADTTANLSAATKAVADAQAIVAQSQRDHATKLEAFNKAKQAAADAQVGLSVAKTKVKDTQDRVNKLQAGLKTAQDAVVAAKNKLATDTAYADSLSHAQENLTKAKQALNDAKADVAAKSAANDAAQAALKTATDNDDAAQTRARNAAAALKRSTDRYNMLLALQKQQEAQAARDHGYHADHGQVVDSNGKPVVGWTVNREGDLVDEDGNIILIPHTPAKSTNATNTSSPANSRRITVSYPKEVITPATRMALYHGQATIENQTANHKLPQTDGSAKNTFDLGIASLMMGLGLAGAGHRKRD